MCDVPDNREVEDEIDPDDAYLFEAVRDRTSRKSSDDDFIARQK
jgi:hypothetical protein